MEVGDKFIYDYDKDFMLTHKFGANVHKSKQLIEANCQYELIDVVEFGHPTGISRKGYFKNITNISDKKYDFYLDIITLKKNKKFKLLSDYRGDRLNEILK